MISKDHIQVAFLEGWIRILFVMTVKSDLNQRYVYEEQLYDL